MACKRWLLSVVLLALPIMTAGVTLETLVMPGPVIEGHAEYEAQCEKCHASFDKDRQRLLCLDCHEEIAEDVGKERGFHGRIDGIDRVQCNQCHREHEGRDADIVQLSIATFDHNQTDFALKDSHTQIKCTSCHAPDKFYRDAPSTCVECHNSADPHEGRLGDQCDDCHSASQWSDAPFDHSQTEFALEDKHRDVACAQCHAGQRYAETPTECHSCHNVNDVHSGRYGDDCAQCHSVAGWDELQFNHDVDTEFRLVARHRDVLCDTCHRGHLFDDELGSECIDCHKADDHHSGRNGEKCADCHDERGWSEPEFDHDADTTFKLTGGHKELTCESCHKGNVYDEELSGRCISCHAIDDVHKGALGSKCSECHRTARWDAFSFNHDTDTDFALRGKHVDLGCNDCHDGGDTRAPLETTCNACHEKDDIHAGQQGEDCAQCHNERGWGDEVLFDHDLTRFPLIGQHSAAPCEECHVSAEFKDTAIACIECHAQDDVHQERFGEGCALCHNPNGWPLWRFDHDTQTQYPLTGAHDGLDCHACHETPTDGDYVELPTDCVSCHAQDDVHKGGFGTACNRCHITDTFEDAQVR